MARRNDPPLDAAPDSIAPRTTVYWTRETVHGDSKPMGSVWVDTYEARASAQSRLSNGLTQSDALKRLRTRESTASRSFLTSSHPTRFERSDQKRLADAPIHHDQAATNLVRPHLVRLRVNQPVATAAQALPVCCHFGLSRPSPRRPHIRQTRNRSVVGAGGRKCLLV